MSEGEVGRAADRYLQHFHESPESQAHVAEVMQRWERLVSLATDRAISELNYPFNVVEMAPYRRTVLPHNEA